MSGTECVFRHVGLCDHTGQQCDSPCKHRIREIDGLTYRDHFELFEKRATKRADNRLKWISVIISTVALLVSVVTAFRQDAPGSSRRERAHGGDRCNERGLGWR
jgi:hypothetical protein